MVRIRFILALALSFGAITCGSDNSLPSSPSTTPAPTPAPTQGGPSSTVTIPMGAEVLGSRAFTPGNLDVAVAIHPGMVGTVTVR